MKARIVLLGPPASGKGTQATMIESHYSIPTISTGALLRDELACGTALGKEADSYTSVGGLVPDAIVTELVSNWLVSHNGKFVCDGFPRTLTQGQAFNSLLAQRGSSLDVVFFFRTPFSVIRDRMLNRLTCNSCRHIFGVGVHIQEGHTTCPRCGGELARRKDDTLEALEKRIEEYHTKTDPLVSFYREAGLLHELEADRDPASVFAQIGSVLEAA